LLETPIMKLSVSLAGCLLAVAVALPAAATPLPNTSTYVGLAKPVVVSSSLGMVAGGGGSFQGTVAGFTTAFWCVDDQLTFGFGNSGLANVILLTSVTSTNTQYGNVTNLVGPRWTNLVDLSGDALPSSASERYAMTAYLISQYTGFNQSVASGARNDAIQRAIWTITNNNTPGILSGYSTISGLENGGDTSIAYWVDRARQFYASVNPTEWAVVSWVVDANGGLAGGPDRQTFLVQVAAVPEPSAAVLYGLGLGVAAMGVRGRRR
jgi:hypothetical protein